MKAIVLDIEGTTTPISFVHDILFPFAKTRIAKFVETHFDKLRSEIEQLVGESSKDKTYTVPFDPLEPGSISTYLMHLIDADRKSTPLKSIQGMIWREGYRSGELVSKVFDDVPPAFERWNTAGVKIAIYSSGSILAQQQLFRYTDHGDLTRFISSYFDTTTGPKRAADSYRGIAHSLGVRPAEIIFVSDVPEELHAASEAGWEVVLCVRPGNAPVDDDIARRILSFDEIA
jgi:enolase-phosphatase E1